MWCVCVCVCGMGSFVLGHGPVSGSCEGSDLLLDSMKGRELF
jgi:hypothetical protein